MTSISHPLLIAGLVPAILFVTTKEDARVKPGHDDCVWRNVRSRRPYDLGLVFSGS
jgi:hypothetical protein